jgi:hypothetical protein
MTINAHQLSIYIIPAKALRELETIVFGNAIFDKNIMPATQDSAMINGKGIILDSDRVAVITGFVSLFVLFLVPLSVFN